MKPKHNDQIFEKLSRKQEDAKCDMADRVGQRGITLRIRTKLREHLSRFCHPFAGKGAIPGDEARQHSQDGSGPSIERSGRDENMNGENLQTMSDSELPIFNERIRDAYVAMAELLQQLREQPDAKVVYDLFSDALIWTDEFPPLSKLLAKTSDWAAIRLVFRFRSSLITGQPERRFEKCWSEARSQFPDWPGFLPWRASGDHAAIFTSLRKKSFALNEIPFEE